VIVTGKASRFRPSPPDAPLDVAKLLPRPGSTRMPVEISGSPEASNAKMLRVKGENAAASRERGAEAGKKRKGVGRMFDRSRLGKRLARIERDLAKIVGVS